MPNDAQSYWRSYEPRPPIETLQDLHAFIEDVAVGSLVWRGVKNEAWPLHSSLYRYALTKIGAVTSDAQFRDLESWVVARAREWNLDRVPSARSGLELLAWMQHTGSPTRFVDVTLNPLVAAWFACENEIDHTGNVIPSDGRLFAIGSTAERLVDDGRSDLPWIDPSSKNYALLAQNLTLVWVPPPVDPRISAQSGALLVGPLPNTVSGGLWYKKGDANNRYSISEVRALTSLPIRAYDTVTPGAIYRQNPLVSVRIAAGAESALRADLERVYNLAPLLLFPDPYGLAGHLRRATPQ